MNKDISLLNWYQLNCNGDWEHSYGITIETLDNPGWSITIDLEDTDVNLEDIEWVHTEENPDNWYGYKIEKGKYDAAGSPSNLEKIILIFKEKITSLNH